MIRINLLPTELQKAARTPPKFFISLVACVALLTLVACAYGYVCMNVMVLKERVKWKKSEVEQYQEKAREVDVLLADIADYKEREKAIISIKTNRIIWSKKLELLCQLTPSYIWITRLEMSELGPGEYRWEDGVTQTGGQLLLYCYSSTDEVDRMTNYRQRLKNVDEFYLDFIEEDIKPTSFYSDFINITPPQWQFVQLPDFLEPSNIRFVVQLDLRPLVERA